MCSTHTPYHPFVWFESGGWWFKSLSEKFGPYSDSMEARYHLMVILGLSRQLQNVIAK